MLPAFGLFPALGGTTLTLQPWRILLSHPGLFASITLTLTGGFAATALSLLAVATFCAAFHTSRGFRVAQALIAPLLAAPHVALALGFLAFASPSGILMRLLAQPFAWRSPPDIATVNDTMGISLIVGLVLKETPFLLLMAIAALNQIPSHALMAAARALGQPAPIAWLKAVFPLVHRQLRLPILAVLAYALSAVDVALLLGPDSPPTLSVLVVRWFFDPDLAQLLPAAAAATLLLALTFAAILAWLLAERLVAQVGRNWAASGRSGGSMLVKISGLLLPALLGIALASLLAAAVWSVAGPWRFPDPLPASVDLRTWSAQASGLAGPLRTTVLTGLASTASAILIAVAALEAVARHGAAARPGLLALIIVPLLVPQAGFLFGMQVTLLGLGADGGWFALIWTHLIFVLPYVLLSLRAPFAAFDPRLLQTAACLGASPTRVLFTVKLPILLRPLLAASAIGIAVSAGQYLATLFAGGGRLASLATEAVTLASGGDRRVLGVFATLQSGLPLLFYAIALALPGIIWRHRAGLRP